MKNNKILIIAAHPDDEILGCGGTIAKLKASNEINIIFMTNGVSARSNDSKKIKVRNSETLALYKYLKIKRPTFFNFEDNKLDAVPILKIIKKIENYINLFKPNIIFTHTPNCLNIDHQKTFEATITACRPIKDNSISSILSFETLSSTEWKGNKQKSFFPNYFINIENEIKNKIKYLSFYKSEIRKFPHSRPYEGVKALAKYRGIISGLKYAEAFELIRYIKK